jgi:two-component system, NarL family, sensor histidine kinase UhpB
MAVEAAQHPRAPRRPRRPRSSLFRRLFAAYAAVVGLAVAALVFAPVTVSVPIALRELALLLAGFTVMLLAYRALLLRGLAPLRRLTVLMHRIDPLAPGQRIDTDAPDAEVASLAQAFNEMLDRLEDERRDSARRALAAQEGERGRIARELHDEIGQQLTGLMLHAETLARRAPEQLKDELEGLREGAREAAEEVRRIARRLRPEALDTLGLQSALLGLSKAVGDRAGLDVRRSLERDLPLTAEEELVIYRVAQESLTNVVRHAGAESVDLRLGRTGDGGVELVVRDDGAGIEPGAALSSDGIRGMRERALLVGARLDVARESPRGTRVTLRLPPAEPGP